MSLIGSVKSAFSSIFIGGRSLASSRSIENPAVPLSAFGDEESVWLGASTTTSGVVVNERKVLEYSPVWRAVQLISGGVMKLPLLVFERDGLGKVRAFNHPLYRLLKRKPNDFMDAVQFRRALTVQALLLGNGYAWIERVGDDVVSLMPLDSKSTSVSIVDGVKVYRTWVDGHPLVLADRDVLHIRGVGDGIKGWSLVEHARNSLGLGMAAESYGSHFFKNGANPSAVIEVPEALNPEAGRRMSDSWNAAHRGVSASHRIAILEQGAKINPYSMSHTDAQFLATREFELRSVANWFNIPSHKLGDTSKTSYSSLESEQQSYLDEALDPWLVTWEQALYDKCLSDADKDSDKFTIEFERLALVRANTNDRAKFYNAGIHGGWLSPDEARGRENLNPIPEGRGAVYYRPNNLEPARDVDDIDVTQEPPVDDTMRAEEPRVVDQELVVGADIMRDAVSDVLRRMSTRVSSRARKASKKPDSFPDWIESEMPDLRSIVVAALDPVMRAARQLGSDVSTNDAAEFFVEDVRMNLDRCLDATPDTLAVVVEKTVKDLSACGRGLIVRLSTDKLCDQKEM